MSRVARIAAASLALQLAQAAAQDPQPREFAWRGTLEVPAQAALVRVPVPGDALARLQSPAAADLRVFDGQAQPVPFALGTPAKTADPPRTATAAFRALPLYAAKEGAPAPRGAVQVRVDDGGQRQSVWVQVAPARTDAATAAPAPRRLASALFDTRAQKDPIAALVVKAQLPANVPVRIGASTSPDLAQWTPVALKGRIYRFEGEGSPANDTLELHAPLALEGRYLRLEWSGQEGVQVDSVQALLPSAEAKMPKPGVALPAPHADGTQALEWQLGFATPVAALELVAGKPNTLLPVRILGRNQASEPWRTLGHTVVYRLGAGDQETTSSPAVLQRPSVRWLRVEATHGMRLDGAGLEARVQFDPVELVFVAGGSAPYVLAAGRASTASAALPLGMLAATTPRKIPDLPAARVVSMQADPAAPAPAWARWMPRGVDSKSAGLWLVLALGVLVLGAVAWSLLRQLDRAKPREPGS